MNYFTVNAWLCKYRRITSFIYHDFLERTTWICDMSDTYYVSPTLEEREKHYRGNGICDSIMHECLRKSLNVPICVRLALDYCELFDINPEDHYDMRGLSMFVNPSDESMYVQEAYQSSGHLSKTINIPDFCAPAPALKQLETAIINKSEEVMAPVVLFPLPVPVDLYITNLANEIAMAIDMTEMWPDRAAVLRQIITRILNIFYPEAISERIEEVLDNPITIQNLIDCALKFAHLIDKADFAGFSPMYFPGIFAGKVNYWHVLEKDKTKWLPTLAAADQISRMDSRLILCTVRWHRNRICANRLASNVIAPMLLSPNSPLTLLSEDLIVHIFRQSIHFPYEDPCAWGNLLCTPPGTPLLCKTPAGAHKLYPKISDYKDFDAKFLHIDPSPDDVDDDQDYNPEIEWIPPQPIEVF